MPCCFRGPPSRLAEQLHFWVAGSGLSLVLLVMLISLFTDQIGENEMFPIAPIAQVLILLGILCFTLNIIEISTEIVTKAEGEINELHIGLGGTMSALFLKQTWRRRPTGGWKAACGPGSGRRAELWLPDCAHSPARWQLHPRRPDDRSWPKRRCISRIFRRLRDGQECADDCDRVEPRWHCPSRGGIAAAASWSFSTISGTGSAGPGSSTTSSISASWSGTASAS